MTLPKFYYLQGTTYLLSFTGIAAETIGNYLGIPNCVTARVGMFGGSSVIKGTGEEIIITPGPTGPSGWIPALDGKTVYWGASGIWGNGDPFPNMLDTDLWNAVTVPYPASTLFIGPSIRWGVDWVVNDILTNLPPGTPVALGGYSQGAAAASCIYNEFRSGRLKDRRSDLRAVIAFGNPMREIGHTFPDSGGYSGAGDIPQDTTTGHGTFHPAAWNVPIIDWFVAQFSRLQDTEGLLYDFTMPGEVISGIGDSPDGTTVQTFVKQTLRVNPLFSLLLLDQCLSFRSFGLPFGNTNPIMGRLAFAPPGTLIDEETQQVIVTDAQTGETQPRSGGGHICYPFYPPAGPDGIVPATGDTSYQIAAKYLRKIGQQIYDEMHPAPPNPANPAVYSWSSTW